MLNIPQLTGLFEPQPYVPPKDAMENNINTITALQDPAAELQRIQAEQIAKGMAQAKFDNIAPQYQQLANQTLKDYQDKSTALYAQNSGFGRLRLNGKQMLEQNILDKNLLMDANGLKEHTKDYLDTMAKAGIALANGSMTKEDYDKFDQEMNANLANPKSIGDLKFTHAVYNKYLEHSTKQLAIINQDNQDKSWNALRKHESDLLSGLNKQGFSKPTADQVKNSIDTQYPTDEAKTDRLTELKRLQLVPQNASVDEGLKLWANRVADQGEKRAASASTTVNMPSWEKNWQPKYRIINGELSFNAKPTDGIIMTDAMPAKDGKAALNPGDLFVPKKTFTENGKRYVTGVTVSKGQITKVGADGSIELSSGASYNPITVPVDDNMKGVLESNYFKPDKEGNPDPTVWGKLSGVKQSTGTKQIKWVH